VGLELIAGEFHQGKGAMNGADVRDGELRHEFSSFRKLAQFFIGRISRGTINSSIPGSWSWHSGREVGVPRPFGSPLKSVLSKCCQEENAFPSSLNLLCSPKLAKLNWIIATRIAKLQFNRDRAPRYSLLWLDRKEGKRGTGLWL
jgi:hypothetical protein